LGSGIHTRKGWTSVDIGDADEQVDLSEFPWPWKSGKVEEILASHIIEHFRKDVAIKFVKECYRILKPGGVLHIAVPDMDKFVECNLTKDWSPLGGYPWTDFNWFFGGDDIREHNPYQRHKYAYNFETLAYILQYVGFSKIRRVGYSDIHNPDYVMFSLYIDAQK